MANERDTAPDVERFPPTQQEPEPREETVARAVRDDPVHGARASTAEDPSQRAGFGRAIIARPHGWGLAGGILGALLGLLLALNATPLEAPIVSDRGAVGTVFGTLGYMVVLGLAFALVFTAIAGLIYSAREDGRTERNVERDTGRGPDGPAAPLEPRRDT